MRAIKIVTVTVVAAAFAAGLLWLGKTALVSPDPYAQVSAVAYGQPAEAVGTPVVYSWHGEERKVLVSELAAPGQPVLVDVNAAGQPWSPGDYPLQSALQKFAIFFGVLAFGTAPWWLSLAAD